MNCDIELHEGLIESGDIVCPFCNNELDSNEKPQDYSVEYDLCCDRQDIINDDSMIVCRTCGTVQGYKIAREYVDFYENRYRIRRKSVYHRKYHVNNTILDIKQKCNIEISCHQKCKIDRVFVEIGKIIDKVNIKRKRMISINFIIRKVLSMVNLPFDNIPISASKKTLVFYNQYWDSVMTIIGDKILAILH